MVAWCAVTAQAAEGPDAKHWRVLIEPKFMKPPVAFEIPNAERTLLVPGFVNAAGEPVYFTREQWTALHLTWGDFFEKARVNAAGLLEMLKPELVRDAKKVVEYAVLRSESPLTAEVIFAPGFLKKFEGVFGATLIVVVPNRNTVFVFPKLASNYREFGPMVLDAYHAGQNRVSIEVFELSAERLRAVGIYDEP